MEDYSKIIEALGIRYVSSKNIEILKPFIIEDYSELDAAMIIVHTGTMYYGENNEVIDEGDILFLPGDQSVKLSFLSHDSDHVFTNDEYSDLRDNFYRVNKDSEAVGKQRHSISVLTFDAKIFDAVNFFSNLSIPPFGIVNNRVSANLVTQVIKEVLANRVGRERLIKLNTESAVVNAVRYIVETRLFVEQMTTNVTYFKDPRLLDVFSYIKGNLEGDLANKVLASVANVSEDYVGQYFKMLTGINPQDYIEYQRMEKAVKLLRTTKKSIRQVGKEVGYKDTAYFCRRFKMMFGIPAGKMRRRETLMKI